MTNELMVKCAKHCDPQTRTIKTPKGLVLAYLAEQSIGEAFGIPRYQDMHARTKEEAQAKFERRLESCLTIINNKLVLETRRNHSKLTKRLLFLDFKEHGDLIFLLN